MGKRIELPQLQTLVNTLKKTALLVAIIIVLPISINAQYPDKKTKIAGRSEKINLIKENSIYSKCPSLLSTPLSTGKLPCLKKTIAPIKAS